MEESLIVTNDQTKQVNFIPRHPSLIRWRGLVNQQLLEALNDIQGISSLARKSLLYRTSSILDEYTQRAHMYSGIYHSGRIIVTVGSLIVPALLSIQSGASSFGQYSNYLYWVTWTISLMVTIFNGILTLFKIEKKYIFLNTLCEQVRSEGWQYIQLTGKYGGHHYSPGKSTHSNELIHFTHSLERIKLNQTNEEYWKSQESQTKVPNGAIDKKELGALYTPTPSTEQLMGAAKEIEDAEEETKVNIISGSSRDSFRIMSPKADSGSIN